MNASMAANTTALRYAAAASACNRDVNDDAPTMFEQRDAELRRALAFCAIHVPAPDSTIQFAYVESGRQTQTHKTTRVFVANEDVLAVAARVRDHDPLIMILADADTPGGNVMAGAGMQEESLFRRTALFSYLRKDANPIADTEALYARGVPVLCSSSSRTHAFIACPGVKMPRVSPTVGRMCTADAEVLRRKNRLIVQVAATMGHATLVAGALGCGVWGCPARQVAEIFREVHVEHDGVLEEVHFAVLGALSAVWAETCPPGPISSYT